MKIATLVLTETLETYTIADKSSLMWRSEIRKIITLKTTKNRVEGGRKPLSLRSLALKAGLSSGALSEIRRGNRYLSPSVALKLVQALPIEKGQKERLFEAIEADGKKTRKLLPLETQALMGHWYYHAILILFDLDDPPVEVSQIAARLNLKPGVCRKALTDLVRFGLLTKTERGFKAVETAWTMGDTGGSEAVRNFHRDGLELSLNALELIPVHKRDFSGLTISGNQEDMEKVRSEVRRFHRRISKLVSRGSRDRIFRLNIQIFPLDDWRSS